ncbi:MAG: S-methyl-5'-thioadenosine phosphorylase [Vicinamibacteria bacterium]
MSTQATAEIGIIGGSGLYDIDGFAAQGEVNIETPFGAPSDAFMVGTLGERRVAFLPRHGRGHRILPSELNFRANIWGMKSLGVKWILSVSAVGSLKEEYAPTHMVTPDQFIDRTFGRKGTFFGEGLVAHVGFAHPICKHVRRILAESSRKNGATTHDGGTYVCMEGPQFSTFAESNLYRSWGADLIGMTNLQEAKLSREAEICYATLAMVTDYDCWRPGHDAVTVDQVVAVAQKNAALAKSILKSAVEQFPIPRDCECESALKFAVMTAPHLVPEQVKKDLAPIIGRYLK